MQKKLIKTAETFEWTSSVYLEKKGKAVAELSAGLFCHSGLSLFQSYYAGITVMNPTRMCLTYYWVCSAKCLWQVYVGLWQGGAETACFPAGTGAHSQSGMMWQVHTHTVDRP